MTLQTGVTTVQRVPKIVGKKGQHQIGQVTSRERGELVTHVGIISASGIALPPVWIFPRCRYDPKRMMQGIAETGPLGLVHRSGWMTSDNFLEVLKHIVKNVRCSAENKILLIMDNHESHLSFQGIEYCRSNGITVLTLPPHTSNKLQPLDRTVFGPFKTFFNQAADSWHLNHPGQTLSIYDLPAMCLQAWDRAATPSNVKSGFKCSGIVPFDRNIFKPEEFLSSYVTDRPDPYLGTELEAGTSADHPSTSNISPVNSSVQIESEMSPSGSASAIESTSIISTKKLFLSPELLKPYPKAPGRKQETKGRKRGKCMIATDTPEKNDIEEKYKKKKPAVEKVNKVKRNITIDSSSEEEEVDYEDNSSDDVMIFDSCDEELDKELDEIAIGTYVVAKVYGKASVRNYVAKIDKKVCDGYEVCFLKRHIASNRFTLINEESALVGFSDIVAILPKPLSDTRARYQDMIYFNIDLVQYSLN